MRTAGFYSIDQSKLKDISKFFSCILMLIGGSPAGTAGGIKTINVGIILFTMISTLRGRDRTEAFGRTIPTDLLQKALTVVCTMLIVVLGSTFILYFTEQNSTFDHGFLDLLFESCSATGTVGVTTGITPSLSNMGKLVIVSCMFLGRLSPMTLVVALNMKLRMSEGYTKYPEERVSIG
jgi:trk system potassium uptake protein TrkH